MQEYVAFLSTYLVIIIYLIKLLSGWGALIGEHSIERCLDVHTTKHTVIIEVDDYDKVRIYKCYTFLQSLPLIHTILMRKHCLVLKAR